MYKLLLILKYLRRKLAPLFAVLAVALCTAMVIIVSSVMGGFLQQFRDAAHRVTGDVVIEQPVTGLPYYQEIIDRVLELPEAAAATAVIESYGLAAVPSGRTMPVQIMGIDPAGFNAVTPYYDTLHWTSQDFLDHIDALIRRDPPLPAELLSQVDAARDGYASHDIRQYAMTFELPPQWREAHDALPVCVPGIALFNQRTQQGKYELLYSPIVGPRWRELTLSVLPISTQGTLGAYEPARAKFVIVNEFKSGLYDIDNHRVYVPFDVLQKMLKLDSYPRVDPRTGESTGEMAPARTHQIMVQAADGVDVAALKQKIYAVVDQVSAEHPDMPLLWVQTWIDRYAGMLGAVENEKVLVTFLFAVVSIVAFTMIAVIFYMIVLDKTHDIGVLRSLGASRAGIASIFLGYGLAIGIVGSLLGLLAASQIVWNINEIQDLLAQSIGFRMWDPQFYVFDKIPSDLDGLEVTWIVLVAIVSSVLGSLIPAFIAARLNPVEALRYE